MGWFKLYDGAYSDAKWPVIARKAKTNVGTVVSIWVALLDYASQCEDRGSLEGFDCETVDALYGYEDGTCLNIMEAMTEKGMIADGRVVNWEKRQPVREDNTAAERKQRWKEKQKSNSGTCAGKNGLERNGTEGNGCGTQKNATERKKNGLERNGTEGNEADKIRIDKIKNNIKNPPLTPQGELEGEEEKIPEISPEPEKPPEPEKETPQEEPGIEFQELRQFWDREMRCEGPMAGFREYKMLKKASDRTGMSCWPGLGVIFDDVQKRKAAHIWNPGYEIGLGRYLAEKTWLAPVVPRASPPALQTGGKQSEGDRAAQKTWENYQNLKAKGIIS